ncbi:MAG: hypothetical protein ACRELG_18935, partial [Gemmataceae bacterium]
QSHLLEHLKEWKKLRQDSTLTAEELARLTAHVEEVDSERKNIEGKTLQDAQAARNAVLSLQEIRERGKRVVEEIEALRKALPSKQTLRYRTPVSHVLQWEGMEFECRHGRVAFIDMAGFKQEIDRAMREEGNKTLTETRHYENVTQPIGPFRLRYKFELDSVSSQVLTWAEVEPMTQERGETVEKALSPGSEFRRLIDSIEPASTAVTLWVYTDSFPLYRKLRDYMHERDIEVAGRPAPEGVGMTYSSLGSHSRGQ